MRELKKSLFLVTATLFSFLFFAVASSNAHETEPSDVKLSEESARALSELRLSMVSSPIPFADPRFKVSRESFDFDSFVQKVGKRSQIGIKRPAHDFFGKGNPKKRYDVIIQSGHFLRKRCCNNKTGSSGVYFYEQDYVAYVSTKVAQILSAKGYNVLLIPADNYSSPLSAKIFLSLHLDGAKSQCSVSTSLGYDDKSDLLGAHTLGLAIASALGIDYDDFTKDNYTTGLSKYYAFSDIKTSIFEAVLELSELSCPKQEVRLAGATADITKNLSSAIEYVLMLNRP